MGKFCSGGGGISGVFVPTNIVIDVVVVVVYPPLSIPTEPIYRLQIQCPGEIVESIQPVLKRRRGHIVQDRPSKYCRMGGLLCFGAAFW
jgi:hypothetical protein